MDPFYLIIPRLSDTAVSGVYNAVAAVPASDRQEPDWRQVVGALEDEMAKRAITFEPMGS